MEQLAELVEAAEIELHEGSIQKIDCSEQASIAATGKMPLSLPPMLMHRLPTG